MGMRIIRIYQTQGQIIELKQGLTGGRPATRNPLIYNDILFAFWRDLDTIGRNKTRLL